MNFNTIRCGPRWCRLDPALVVAQTVIVVMPNEVVGDLKEKIARSSFAGVTQAGAVKLVHTGHCSHTLTLCHVP